MTNLKIVYPDVSLIPSGGISVESAGKFIRCEASAISGARNFYDESEVAQHGIAWLKAQAQRYLAIAAEARASAYPLP